MKKNNDPLILIVDDVPKNLQVLGNILNQTVCRISATTSGKQALEMAENIQPDLILLDIIMPDFDGFEVCKKLKKSETTKNIPIIFLTAKTETEDIVNGFKIGAVDYITKPIKSPELLAKINTHLKIIELQNKIKKLEKK